MTALRRPDGSRAHDHLVDTHVHAFQADGWDVVRPRHRPIPLIHVRHGGQWNLVCLQGGPFQNPAFPDIAPGFLLLEKMERPPLDTRDPSSQRGWHHSTAIALIAIEERLRRTGRVLRLWRPVNGHIGVIRPDAILFKAGRVIAVEVTSGSILAATKRLPSFDEVHVIRYRGRQVFRPDAPPRGRLHRFYSPTNEDPVVSRGTLEMVAPTGGNTA